MLMDQIFKWALKSRKGSTSPIILCVTVVIVLVAAVVADIGYTAVQRSILYSSAKKAAIAGAEALSTSRKIAENAVRIQALKSTSDLTKLDISISDNSRELTVSMKRPFDFLFIKFFGLDKKEISSKVTVRLSGVISFKGARPFGVLKKNIEFGTRYVLTNKATNVKGEFKVVPLKLGDGNYKNSIILGYPGKLKTGDSIKAILQADADDSSLVTDVKEGIDSLAESCRHDPKCTFEKYDSRCTRIIVIPVLTTVDNSGLYNISGFAAFFIEECRTEGDAFYITGRFIRHAVQADMSDDAEDYGLAGIRVIGS